MAEEKSQVFDIRKIYLKDSSLESPNAPDIFLENPAQPEVSIEATIKTKALEQEDFYEVVLGITITSKIGDKTAFLVEVMQAGVFQLAGLVKEELPLALEIACPNILLPFAREAISDLVGKAGFPQLLISPINFETLFQQKQAQIQAAAEEASKAKQEGSAEQ
ncbi:MAG: protein-export chaperone SecB [Gammaproteobacteria bacterium]|nr:protein-export chaperone SecB [Gammaproteobacteria bacterium]